ncbi:MAG: hypothetical protein PG978_001341 [Wolbachia endosymbiont of Ctenocephalides felis wCfeF]|nr:MAG: hypothetical protein PG978_001341 [Wolbachia endosymbiont of Ctenocephalides felis wCfeF]
MANSGINIALDSETSRYLAELSEFTRQPTQKLAEKLFKEAIELEMEDLLASKISNERDVEGAEELEDSEDIWK